uniref:Putative lipocalin-3 1 n=1 Tax=Amblyomma triste TaxID=251400 RepID=A0A023GDI4_AMBTT
MIFTLALCLLAAATAAAKENAENYIRPLDIRVLVQVKERLIVIMRTHTTRTHFRCQSAKKVKSLGNRRYVYNLVARNGTYTYSPYTLSNVTVKLEKIQRYKETYMSTYKVGRTRVTHKLLKIGRRGQCYVIYVDKSDGHRGCELLVPYSELLYRPPKSCNDYFNQWCPGKRLQLYEPDCVYI